VKKFTLRAFGPLLHKLNVSRLSSLDRLTSGFVILALFWGGLLGFWQITGKGAFLDGFENLTVDWRCRLAGPRPTPHTVVIAAIDDEAVREAGGYPLSRETLARIVRVLAGFQPRALAIDIAFLDDEAPEIDQELAEALRSTKSVIAAVGLFERTGARNNKPVSTDLTRIPHPTNILWPAAALKDAGAAGIVNITTDMGIPRFFPLVYRTADGVASSFALATASVALDTKPALARGRLTLAKKIVSVDLGYHLPLRFYGPHGSFRQFSAAKVLRGELGAEAVRGRVVLLGITATGVADVFATPFDRVVPGVEILATGIANILAGEGLVRSARVRWIDAGAAVALPCLVVLLMATRRAFVGLSLAALTFASWAAVDFVAFLGGYWLSMAVPLAALLPVTIAFGAAQQARERYSADRLTADKAALIRFQSPALIHHILETPGFLEQPVPQNVAVVFLDLSGFTGAAEALGAMWARDFLAGFHSIVAREVASHDGFVASFMGDGAMIVFGLPEPRSDDAARALLAALSLRASIDAWLDGLPPAGQVHLSVRIGGHFGPAVLSRLGSERQQHITATGDTVNVASRLLEVSKIQQCAIVVSEDLFTAADGAQSSASEKPDSLVVDIRGRAQPLRVRMWP
jgi:adenylate cyclase